MCAKERFKKNKHIWRYLRFCGISNPSNGYNIHLYYMSLCAIFSKWCFDSMIKDRFYCMALQRTCATKVPVRTLPHTTVLCNFFSEKQPVVDLPNIFFSCKATLGTALVMYLRNWSFTFDKYMLFHMDVDKRLWRKFKKKWKITVKILATITP